MPFYMYVSISQEDRILIFALNPDTGELRSRGNVSVLGRPAALAVDPEEKFLYVGRRDAREISSLLINQRTGELSHIGTVPLPSDPCYLATDRKGKFMLSAYYAAGAVAVHAIGNDGAVRTSPIQWLKTATGAHCIQTSSSNRFAFVPHIDGPNGPNLILQYRFDEHSGNLTPNSPSKVIPEEGAGPRHFCFHPAMDILYFSNEQGSSVTAYYFDRLAGTLTAFQTISTLPEGYTGINTCSQIQISPTGKFLYAPNRGHNSIACFSVNVSSGRLTSIGQVPTEAVPRAFSLDRQGKFLYAAGEGSGRLASYRIDGYTGQLDPLCTYNVGQGPMWVLITRQEG